MKIKTSQVLVLFFLIISVSNFTSCVEETKQTSDPLPSWNAGKSKQAIIDFVIQTTTEGNIDFIPVADRIAVFDNDGTLWSEQPYYFQLQFALDRIKEIAPQHPEWNKNPLLTAVVSSDLKTVLGSGEKGLMEIVMASHTGMTTSEFENIVKEWINKARHPKTNKLYKEMVYQPMLELLDYLRANGFKTYIVSGGGIEFMRPGLKKFMVFHQKKL